MHEIGAAIVTNSAEMQAHCRITHLGCGNARQANVDGFGLHVQTVEGDTGMRAAASQKLVAPRRAVSADNVDLAAGIAKRRRQIVEKVKEAGIEMPHVSRAMVAQIVIESVQRFGDISITAAVNDVEPLVSVGVIEAQVVLGHRSDRRRCTATQRRRQQNHEIARKNEMDSRFDDG